jgi:hypothetical protein
MADERVFLHNSGIYVSNTRVVLHGTTYATANITSVAKRFTPASTGCATLLIVGGGVTLLFALALFGSSGDQGASVVMLLFAMGVIAGGIVWLRSLKPTFHVFLASASAERQSLSSQDEALIDRVTSAISDAIIYRG